MRGKTRRSVIWLVAALHVPAIDVRYPELDLFLWTACASGASRDRLAAIFSTLSLASEVERE